MSKITPNKPLYPPKDHQAWARLKSKIHNNITERNPYREGEIYWFYFGNNIGSEQDGKHKLYHRPAIIVRGFSEALVWVVPLSRTKRTGPYYHVFHYNTPHGKRELSKALLSQMRPFDISRIAGSRALMGWTSEETLDQIKLEISRLITPIKYRP